MYGHLLNPLLAAPVTLFKGWYAAPYMLIAGTRLQHTDGYIIRCSDELRACTPFQVLACALSCVERTVGINIQAVCIMVTFSKLY